ncbi:hypothetical protein ACFWDA_24345 [Rhodococcus zopfii]|uniref:hypothetical protein n=1 Tax=Rhodococcus TaxID=1827 RepID=UPI00082F68C2|nr:hypothetical protein [Rhodococcus phenolicus]
MTAQYLSLLDVSDHSGVRFETLKSLVRRGKFPEPDAIIGLGEHQKFVRGWKRTTIDTWLHGYAPQVRQSPGEND